MMALLSSKEPFSYSNCSLLSTKLSVDRCINVEVPMRTGKFERRWLCLPSFIIAGAMKSGTGELMRWLNLHPFMQSGEGEGGRREVHFFGSTHLDQSPCPLLDYVRFFPVSDQKLANTKRSTTVPSTSKEVTGLSSESGSLFDANRTIQPLPFFTFDKSPSYIRDGRALAQIATTMPKAKLIVLLREPADRAYSEFRHHCLRARYRRLRIAATVLCSSTHLSNTQPWNRSRNRTISDEDRNSSPKPRATKGERASKGGKDSPVWRFEVGSIVRADIVQCRVFEGQADDALAQAPIESKEIMRLLEPVSRCSYADFAVYYFGPSQKRNFTRASGVARAAAESESEASSESTRTLLVNGWAWEEYSHGLYHMQIRRALRWFTPSQILVLSQQELLRDPLPLLRRVELFAGAPRFDFSMHARRKAGADGGSVVRRAESWTEWMRDSYRELAEWWGLPTDRADVLSEGDRRVRDRLRRLYAPHNRELAVLLNQLYNMTSLFPMEM